MNDAGVRIAEIPLEDTLTLRNDVLRPGYARSECVFEGDDDTDTRHFGALDNNDNVVGILSVYRRANPAVSENNGNSYQIRAMATNPHLRGLGIGYLLINAAEEYVRKCAGNWLWANARSSAVAFYRKAGYEAISEEFMIEPIGPHFLVCKPLQ